MAVKTWYRASGVVGAAAVLVLAGCGSVRRRSPAATPSAAPRAATWPPTAAPAGENGDQTQIIRDAINGSGARNVIMLLGDGMGDSENCLSA